MRCRSKHWPIFLTLKEKHIILYCPDFIKFNFWSFLVNFASILLLLLRRSRIEIQHIQTRTSSCDSQTRDGLKLSVSLISVAGVFRRVTTRSWYLEGSLRNLQSYEISWLKYTSIKLRAPELLLRKFVALCASECTVSYAIHSWQRECPSSSKAAAVIAQLMGGTFTAVRCFNFYVLLAATAKVESLVLLKIRYMSDFSPTGLGRIERNWFFDRLLVVTPTVQKQGRVQIFLIHKFRTGNAYLMVTKIF